MNIIGFIFFFIIVLTVYASMNMLVYFSVSRGLELGKKAKLWLKISLVFLSSLYIAGELLGGLLKLRLLTYAGAVWIGVLSISFSLFLIMNIFVFIAGRRFRKIIANIFIISAVVISAFSVYRGSSAPVLKEIDIYSSKIPLEKSGFSIIHLTDLHLGKLNTSEWLKGITETVSGLEPDITFITGDLIDMDICDYDEYCSLISGIESKQGIFAVPGNHEYYAGGVETLSKFTALGNFNLLVNESFMLGNWLNIIGLDDKTAMTFGLKGPDMDESVRGLDLSRYNILLYHQPLDLDYYAKYGMDLILCGHTHAGQIPPMDLLVRLYYKYSFGLFHSGETAIYTSCGTGTWGPPMRLFSSSEIIRIRLFHKKEDPHR